MSYRYTKQDVQDVFQFLCDSVGVKRGETRGEAWDNIGCWLLDHNPTYGGYVIEQISNDSGGVSLPMGEMRRGPTRFAEDMHFAIKAIEAHNRAQKEVTKDE